MRVTKREIKEGLCIHLALTRNLWIGSESSQDCPKKTKPHHLAERFTIRRDAILIFVYGFKVPFDNNLAKRDIRMLKVRQKISGRFRSACGAQILSCILIIRKQHLSV